jgi:hypothetical protein
MSAENPVQTPSAPKATLPGLPKRKLVIIGLVFAAIWAFAIHTGSVVVITIAGVLTAVAGGLLVWALRAMAKQRKLVALLEGATASKEARAAAIETLAQGKDGNEITHLIARAQLLAQDDPTAALELLERRSLQDVPPSLQDDYALLRAQLYLQHGRARDARPLVDTINFENFETGERRQARAFAAAVIADTWGRTNRAQDALALLARVDLDAEPEPQVRIALLAARVFAHFGAGKRRQARADLQAISAIDVDQLGRFLHPRFKVHPELQKLARQVAEENPAVRKRSTPRGAYR